MATNDAPVASELLDSWKEIAAYLKRDESTVRRWEEEGLPVHRRAHKKQASVYAYKSEIDAWWQEGPRQLTENAARGARRSVAGWVIAGLIFFAMLGVWLIARSHEQAPTRVTQLTTLPGWEDSPTWSPDGRAIAYCSDDAGKLHINVQQIGGGQAVRFSDSDADEAQPAWSPDGSRIAFVSSSESRSTSHVRGNLLISSVLRWSRWHPFFAGNDGDVWVRPSAGGPRRRIAQDAYYPAWAPDGKELIYVGFRQGKWGLFAQDADHPRKPRNVAVGTLPHAVGAIAHPAWSPDGKWIAFTGAGDDPPRVYVVPSEGGQAYAVTEANTDALMPSWSPDGRSLFFSSDRGGSLNLWKAPFQNARLGPPRQVTVGGGDDLQGRPAPQGNKIAYSTERTASDIWQFDLDSGATVRVTAETTLEDNARPSPDGSLLAFASDRLGGNHLWLLHRRTGRLTRVTDTSSSSLQQYSFWSLDGQYLYYWTQALPAPAATVWQYEVASGTSRKVYENSGGGHFCLSADGKYLIALEGTLDRIELASGKTERLTGIDGSLYPACSPDGRWIAVQVHRGADRDIWIVPYAGGAPRQLTSGPAEDSHPVWSADSRLVYFTRDHRDIYVVPVTGGEPKPVTHYNSLSTMLDYPAMSGDGKKILFTRNDKTGDIYVLENPRED